VREFKRSLLRDTLRKTGGNQTKAAEHLSLSRPYLVRLMSLLDARGEAGPGGRRAARGGAEREE
jgi:DNA-binding NtrC family response regulator